jgi:hypothetical protein
MPEGRDALSSMNSVATPMRSGVMIAAASMASLTHGSR